MMKTPVRKRVRRDHGAWRTLLDEQVGSGLSQKAFCRQRGLALSSFSNAKRRLSQGVQSAPATTDFVELEMSGVGEPPPACRGEPGWDVELTLFDGVILRMRRG